jgi:hypothetical protein
MHSTTGAAALPELSESLLWHARENHVYQSEAVKTAYVRAVGRDAGFAAWRELLGFPGDEPLRRKRLLGLLEGARERAQSLVLREAGGLVEFVAPPRIVGEGNHRPLRSHLRSRYVACFADARVRSRSAVVEFDDALLLDFEGDELAGIDDRLEVDPAIFLADGDHVWSHAPFPAQPVLELEEAFMLSGAHTWAFGHWMWEYLPRYVEADMGGALPPMPVLVDAGMPPQHQQGLRALMRPGSDIIELPSKASARVQRLWVAPTPMYMPMFEVMNERFGWDLLMANPSRFATVAQEMNRRVDASMDTTPGPESPRRVYFARKPFRHRQMRNGEEIEAMLHERGFTTVYPEDLDFDAQVRVLRGAEWVVGPEGSAMYLGFFARPGTRFCILNHPYTVHLAVLTGLLEELHMDVGVIAGPALTSNPVLPHFIDYEVDPRVVAAYLDAEGCT